MYAVLTCPISAIIMRSKAGIAPGRHIDSDEHMSGRPSLENTRRELCELCELCARNPLEKRDTLNAKIAKYRKARKAVSRPRHRAIPGTSIASAMRYRLPVSVGYERRQQPDHNGK